MTYQRAAVTRALNADLHAGRFSVHFATRRKRFILSAHHSVERTLRAHTDSD